MCLHGLQDGYTPLHAAAIEGQVAVATMLLNRGAEIGAMSSVSKVQGDTCHLQELDVAEV